LKMEKTLKTHMKNLVGHAIESLLNRKIERKWSYCHMFKITCTDTNENHHKSCKYPIICKKLKSCWIEKVIVYWTCFAILNTNKWKCLTQDSKEYSCCTNACIKEFYISVETPKSENERGDTSMSLVMWKWNMQ
jgi:hypothetical protein